MEDRGELEKRKEGVKGLKTMIEGNKWKQGGRVTEKKKSLRW